MRMPIVLTHNNRLPPRPSEVGAQHAAPLPNGSVPPSAVNRGLQPEGGLPVEEAVLVSDGQGFRPSVIISGFRHRGALSGSRSEERRVGKEWRARWGAGTSTRRGLYVTARKQRRT